MKLNYCPLFIAALFFSAPLACTKVSAYTVQEMKQYCQKISDNYIGIAGYNKGILEAGIQVSNTPDIRRQNIELLQYAEKNCPYAL